MARFTLRAGLLALLCLTQAGCLESLTRGSAANSGRTETAYSNWPPQSRPTNKTVEDYVKRLEEVQTAQQEHPAGTPIRPARIPVVPLQDEDLAASPSTHGAFGPHAPRRHVTIPEAPTPEPTRPFAAAKPSAAAPLAPAPAAPQAPASTMAGLVDAIQRQAMAEPDNLDLQLQARMFLAAAGRDGEALEPIPGLAPAENEKVAELLRMMMSARDRGAPTPEKAAARLAALEDLMEQLKAVADLQIPVVKLCRQVDGYGVYAQFTSNTFLAGQTQPVIVYCELRNFSITPDATGMHRTRLNLKLALHNAQGGLAQPAQNDTDIEDVSANRRNDFYLTRVFYIRDTLAPGDYTLKVTVEDPGANKVRSESIPIKLVKPGKPDKE